MRVFRTTQPLPNLATRVASPQSDCEGPRRQIRLLARRRYSAVHPGASSHPSPWAARAPPGEPHAAQPSPRNPPQSRSPAVESNWAGVEDFGACAEENDWWYGGARVAQSPGCRGETPCAACTARVLTSRSLDVRFHLQGSFVFIRIFCWPFANSKW